MSEQLDEFFEKVGTAKPNMGLDLEKRGGSIPAAPEGQVRAGKIAQYSLFDTGYLPTTTTVKTLPPGCYKPVASQVGLWLDPVNLVTDTLIQFPDTKSDSVIAEIEAFWGLKGKFREFGFSHKRGFLLWGAPGSGKTCTVAIIIKKMIEKNGLVLVADNPSFLSEGLAKIRSVEPEREMVVVWEDLDAVISRFGESEVLAVLDGESQVDNIVFLATTNYPERLDDRIVNRPSRFDRIEKIDMPSEAARRMYLDAKVKTTRCPEGVDLVAETSGLSIAHLRELIVAIWCQGNSSADVLKRLKKMKIRPDSTKSSLKMGIAAEECARPSSAFR